MLPKAYDPAAVEDSIYKRWEESGVFRADATSSKSPFTISMPPPNATGQLHLGHAVMLGLEDIFIRFARMNGKEALWVPGTDHAAIATENVVIRELKKKGIRDPRAELGREKLIEEIKKYIECSRDTIRSQVRKMGGSCDWSRERYTMDASLNRCVNEVFKMMYEDGLIYRGNRIVNWDPNLQTNVSDDEIVYEERRDPYFTFQYGPFQISTSRPETKFGDKYVVVHPDDDRYKAYKHGDTFECEWINGTVRATVIKDAEIIDMEQGTGCMTVTPWHDKADFDLSQRHKIECEQVIDFDGKLLPIAGEFAGMHIEQARPLVVEKLKEKGLLVGIDENYLHNVALNSRGGGMIEPQIRLQWFIDVNKKVRSWRGKWSGKELSLKEVMQDVVRSGDIKIIPERFEKTYFHWIDNLRDWCISRQIYWGHRVPVWYCEKCEGKDSKTPRFQDSKQDPKTKNQPVHRSFSEGGKPKTFVSVQTIPHCPDCGSSITQDPDTLDTWFSSALWTWSTLVDPELTKDFSLDLATMLERSPDYQKFHPTQVMETGYDILFFWVARMILMTTYATGRIPFEAVYLHGLIRTRDGAKMSKSHPETMIDPLAMIAKYGADALRLSMIVGQSPGNDSRLYEEKIAGYRNFVNKLWNASRFVLMTCEKEGVDVQSIKTSDIRHQTSALADRALLSELQKLIADVSEGLEKYRLSEAGERLYSFTWDFFCDWYLEISKGSANIPILIHTMRTLLTLLHPYCPFVTEELWGQFKPKDAGMLLREVWPQADQVLIDQEASDGMQLLIDIVSVLRGIRSDNSIEPGKEIEVVLVTQKKSLLQEQAEHIRRLVKIGSLTMQSESFKGGHAATAFTKHAEVHVPLAGIIDIAKERERLTKEKEQLGKFLAGIQSKLGNEQFVANAPEEVISKERQKETDARDKLQKIEEKLRMLG